MAGTPKQPRRTAQQTTDILGRTIKVGDVVAIAVAATYSTATTSQTLVEVRELYLDDSSGQPYYNPCAGTFYRDQHGVLRDHPSDASALGWKPGNVVRPRPDVAYVPYQPKPNQVGSDYRGVDQVVVIQEVRIVGRTLDGAGNETGKRNATYEPYRAVRVLTGDELQALRNGTLPDR